MNLNFAVKIVDCTPIWKSVSTPFCSAFQWSGLKHKLPDNVHLLTLEQWRAATFLLRLEHFYEKNEDAKLSKPAVVSLKVWWNIWNFMMLIFRTKFSRSVPCAISALSSMSSMILSCLLTGIVCTLRDRQGSGANSGCQWGAVRCI